MSTRLYALAKATSTPTPTFTPVRGGLLQRKCACGGAPGLDGICPKCRSQQLTGLRPPLVQTKLTVGQPGDKYEQEADQVAETVMRMPEPRVQRQVEPEEEEEEETLQTKSLAGQITPLVQRQVEPEEEEEEEPIQAKLMDGALVQRQEEEPEEEKENEEILQTKPSSGQITSQIQRQAEVEEEDENEIVQPKEHPNQTPEVTPDLEARINSLRGGGQPLDPATRAFMGPRFGYDFSKVRVHTDEGAVETARALNARAFTVGGDIVLGAAQYQPETNTGKQLLAHELTHVMQQDGDAQLQRRLQPQKGDIKGNKVSGSYTIPLNLSNVSGLEPILDDKVGGIVGFKHSSGGVTKYYDLEGNRVWIEEKGLESPLIDPFDLLFIASGIWRIGTSVTISALGKASLRQLPKAVVIRLRNVAKLVRKIKKMLSPGGGGAGKLPQPLLPAGVKGANEFGTKIMRWGTGHKAARERIATLTREELERNGVTREMAEAWRDFYRNEMDRNPANPSAAGRADLMQRAVKLLSGGK